MTRYGVGHILGRTRSKDLQLVPRTARFRSSVTATFQQPAVEAEQIRDAEWESALPYEQIPGPKPIPILGNVWRFFPNIGDLASIPHIEITKMLYKKYGPICKLVGLPGRNEQVFIFDPEATEKIFRNEGPWPIREGLMSFDYYRRLRPEYFEGATGLASTQGKEWSDFRSAVNQIMMQPKNTKMYVPGINDVADDLIIRMRRIRDNNLEMPDDFFNELNKWSLESITFLALDKRLNCLPDDLDPDSEAQKMIAATHNVFDCMFKLDVRPSLWRWISTPAYRSLVKTLDFHWESAWKHIQKAMNRLQALSPEEREKHEYSVLEKLLIKNENPKIAVTMALDMLIAGVDTTSNTSANIIYRLAKNPDKQRKLQEELARVYPDPTKPITSAQLEDLKYLRACIKEGMRLDPIVPGTLRRAVKDMVLLGYRIPKGVDVAPMVGDIAREERYYKRALEFLPERWLPGKEYEELKPSHPFLYMPFGFGPRMCIGRRFAQLEMEVLLAKLFGNFNIEWHAPPLKKEMRLIVNVNSPLKFRCIDRT